MKWLFVYVTRKILIYQIYEEIFLKTVICSWHLETLFFFPIYFLLFYFVLSFGELEYGKNAYKFSGKQSYKLTWPLV